nr:hypothetical protein [Tanacetum cinerariifolium]
MFKRYPDSFKMPVYPSHRGATVPADVFAAIKKNAVNTKLVGGGNGLENFETAVPFPIPKDGLEVIWNHITRYRGGSVKRQRRVRRAPQVSYDGPGTAADGLRTSDNLDMYNGAPDRYDWKLIGKQEMYIASDSYKLDDPKLKYADIVRPGHINQDLARYELRRVWHVTATLKEASAVVCLGNPVRPAIGPLPGAGHEERREACLRLRLHGLHQRVPA